MEYYIQFNGQTIGPMTKEQIGAYRVTRDTPSVPTAATGNRSSLIPNSCSTPQDTTMSPRAILENSYAESSLF